MAGYVYQLNIKPWKAQEEEFPKTKIEKISVHNGGAWGDFNSLRYKVNPESRKRDDLALHIMPLDFIRKLNEKGWPVKSGDLGDNITIGGIYYERIEIGSRYRIGSAAVEITERCLPGKSLEILSYVGKSGIETFIADLRDTLGWYARVLEGGIIKTRDPVTEMRPARKILQFIQPL